MRSGGCAGSSRALRLDPFALPVRYFADDAAADGRVREIELHRERVVLRRSLAGMRMALAIMLEHRDPALALPLFRTSHADEAIAEWRAWSQVLGLPLLLADQAEALHAPDARLRHMRIARPRPRRRRRSPLKNRRPSILLRRGFGKVTEATLVHRGEHEVIARN